jgi:hypothetical protein
MNTESLVGVQFGHVIPRSIQLLWDCSAGGEFSASDQKGQGCRPPNFRNFSNSFKPSQMSATSNRVVAACILERPTGVPSEADVRTPGRGACPPPPNRRPKTGSTVIRQTGQPIVARFGGETLIGSLRSAMSSSALGNSKNY